MHFVINFELNLTYVHKNFIFVEDFNSLDSIENYQDLIEETRTIMDQTTKCHEKHAIDQRSSGATPWEVWL